MKTLVGVLHKFSLPEGLISDGKITKEALNLIGEMESGLAPRTFGDVVVQVRGGMRSILFIPNDNKAGVEINLPVEMDLGAIHDIMRKHVTRSFDLTVESPANQGLPASAQAAA